MSNSPLAPTIEALAALDPDTLLPPVPEDPKADYEVQLTLPSGVLEILAGYDEFAGYTYLIRIVDAYDLEEAGGSAAQARASGLAILKRLISEEIERLEVLSAFLMAHGPVRAEGLDTGMQADPAGAAAQARAEEVPARPSLLDAISPEAWSLGEEGDITVGTPQAM